MTKLSVNINKIATLRNARGGNNPNVLAVARDAEIFGAQGITVHPRPDERHIRYQDVHDIRPIITTEFNIEGNPIGSFTELVLAVKPTQVTLVPDGHDQLTSNHGWDTLENKAFLTDICKTFKDAGIRTSIFVDADPRMVEGAKVCGADRVELYTEPYASGYQANRESAIAPFVAAAEEARRVGLGLECRSRPVVGEPAILSPNDSLDRRGFHRSRAHLRRPVPGTQGDYQAILTSIKIRL